MQTKDRVFIVDSPVKDLINQSIKVKLIIEQSGLDPAIVAKHLFPTNKYPKLALNRIIEGHAFLDSSQMHKLAAMTNMTVSELYGGEWKQTSKEDIITFTTGTYRAELNTKTWLTKIFDSNSLFHEAILHSGATALSEYLNELNSIIINHKQKTS